jgi:hypothetical protein
VKSWRQQRMIKIHKEVLRLHKLYLDMLPLDLHGKPLKEINGWKKNAQLKILDFSRILAVIYYNKNLREITRSGCDLDLDNLEPILSLLVQEGLIKFTCENFYEILDFPEPNKIRGYVYEQEIIQNPDSAFNQFPCSVESRTKRIEKLILDYPYVQSMNVGLMGDDDLVSLELARRTNFTPIVFELDKKIINKISSTSKSENLKIIIVEKDLRELSHEDYQIDTFFADPPYNVAGVLTFLYSGLKFLGQGDRIYLIANQMFLGKLGLQEIFTAIAGAGIYPVEILNAFNEYPLPREYRETRDLLAKFNNLDTSKLMSSSSSLFVLGITKLNLESLKERISLPKDIYNKNEDYVND